MALKKQKASPKHKVSPIKNVSDNESRESDYFAESELSYQEVKLMF